MLLFLIPTAKELLENCPSDKHDINVSPMTQEIIDGLSQKNLEELMTLYHFKKTEAAKKEYRRWQQIKQGNQLVYKALDLYNGLMYRSMKHDLSNEARQYLDKHALITTSLYGIIPLNHPIHAHRLDFSNPLTIANQSLKSIWKPHYNQFLEEHQEDTIISLLSSEFETVFAPTFRKSLITVSFFEQDQHGQLKQHSTISKKGRGYFLKAAAENQITSLEELKTLTFEGYYYQPSKNPNELTYIRHV